MKIYVSPVSGWQSGVLGFDSLHPLQLRFAAKVLLKLAPANGLRINPTLCTWGLQSLQMGLHDSCTTKLQKSSANRFLFL